ncbi:DUF4232 domain-containing protein [Streptomyces sp. NPDC048606]|uniref:DUF4232 domain-containing protein n=1 Tax=Streptomyces sp. NPDC048606 TaxID=3154726 RepID=UPI0034182145
MHIHRSRVTALAGAIGLALTLAACGGAGAPGAAPEAPQAPTASATPNAAVTPVASATPTASATSATPVASATPDGKGTEGSAESAADDAYAYKHPCSARNLTVEVTSAQGLPATVRVVAVTNKGSKPCGLDYHPAVGFSAKGAALGVQATPPEGLGGAPAHPVRPGATTYAAVDLNPSGGRGPVADEINILADAHHMPNADGVSLPLVSTGTVAAPRVGLYHLTARDSLDTLRSR